MSDTKARLIRNDLSRKLQNVRNALDDAQTRWEQAGSIVTSAYIKAYDNHHSGINKAHQAQALQLSILYGVGTAVFAGIGLSAASTMLQAKLTSAAPGKLTPFKSLSDFFSCKNHGDVRINATEDGIQIMMDKILDIAKSKHISINAPSKIKMKPQVYKEALSRHIRNEFAPLKETCTAMKTTVDEHMPLSHFKEGGPVPTYLKLFAAAAKKLPMITMVAKHPFYNKKTQDIYIDILYGQLSAVMWWAWVLKNQSGNHFGLGVGAHDAIIDAMAAPPDPNLFSFAKMNPNSLKGMIAKNPVAWLELAKWAKTFTFHFDKQHRNSVGAVFARLWPGNFTRSWPK